MSYDTTVFMGLYVHKNPITVACVQRDPDACVIDVGPMGIQPYTIDRLLKTLLDRGRSQLVYEDDPCAGLSTPIH